MKTYEATEVAYKNGYKKGYEDGKAAAVEVVRCCSCEKHNHDGATGYCNRWEKWTKMSDFCSYGERSATE